MAEWFSFVANGLILIVTADYIRRLVWGGTVVNAVTWLVSFVVMFLNAATYAVVVGWNPYELALPVIVTVGMGTIFFYAVLRGKFASVDRFDMVAFVLAFVVGVVWKATGDAVVANIMLQAVLFISFLPTIRGLINRSLRDHPLPWALAVLSYGFQVATLLADPAGWHWTELVFPAVNGMIGNGSVAVLAWWRLRE